MFTGIVECLGTITDIQNNGSNVNLTVSSPITHELKIDQSVAHNGVCLTVIEIADDRYTVTAVEETLKKTNLGRLNIGDEVNLERALKTGDRLDGHFVQGHVDTVGTCISKTILDGSWLFTFSFPKSFANLIIEKGSICINGVSLTAFDVDDDRFTVTIIPYTYEHTCFKHLSENDIVNLEFDLLGKYFLRSRQLDKNTGI
ncbi:MAG: riboflavin synthase [Chitinophagales bacterium]|nr:riboflavin synthase [Chitinophagaceae bacterium]MCB9063743.1 riboflavin synthase [Chitinophagales bacterium]